MENKSPQQFLQFRTRPEVGVRDVQGWRDSAGVGEGPGRAAGCHTACGQWAAPVPLHASGSHSARLTVPQRNCTTMHFLSAKVQGAEIIGKLEKNVDGDIAAARDWCYYG